MLKALGLAVAAVDASARANKVAACEHIIPRTNETTSDPLASASLADYASETRTKIISAISLTI